MQHPHPRSKDTHFPACTDLQEEDICTLHAWIEYLSGRQFICFGSPHDLRASDDSLEIVLRSNIHDECPVSIWLFVDFFGCTQELNFLQVHADCLPHLDHILANLLDLLQITTHLIIELSKPISHPELEGASSLGNLVHTECFQHSLSHTQYEQTTVFDTMQLNLSNVHSPGGFESVVGNRIGFVCQQTSEFFILDTLFSNTAHENVLVLRRQPADNCFVEVVFIQNRLFWILFHGRSQFHRRNSIADFFDVLFFDLFGRDIGRRHSAERKRRKELMSRRFVSIALRQLSGFAGLNGLNNAEDFLPVAREAVKKTDGLISRIGHVPPGAEVVEVLDEISDSVCRVADVANFCYSNHPDENWRSHSVRALQFLIQYIGKLNTNEQLFTALQASLAARSSSVKWTSETQIVAESLHREFVNCGMGSNKSQDVQEHISAEHALTMKFQRCVAEHKEVHPLTLKDPSVLPDPLRNRCVQHQGQYHLPITPSHYMAIVHSVGDEDLRKRAYCAHFQSLQQNVETLKELLNVRRLWSDTLGWKSFAHFKLQDSIATDPEAVIDYLTDMAVHLKPAADEDVRILREMKGSEISAWDVPYYTVLKQKQVVDSYGSAIFSDFDMQSVINGIAQILEHCMDIEMIELETDGCWDSNVQMFAFRQASDGDFIGHLYMDLLGRQNKRPENAHYTLRCGRDLHDGQYQTPIIALITNFSSKRISFFELRSLLHEFGHVLHSLLSNTRFQHLFGTRGPLDLVEIPSHFFENMAYSPDALQYMAGVDLKSHLLISRASLENLIEVNRLFSSLRTQEQIQIALFDQLIHAPSHTETGWTSGEVMERVVSQDGSVPYVPDTFKEAWLTHLTTYGARYYSYLFSRRIANLAWETHIGEDIFNKSKWNFIREHLFQPGGAVKPQDYAFELVGKDCFVKRKGGWTPML